MAFFVIWFMLACLVGALANSRGRSWFGFFLLSLVFSPLLGLIVVLVMRDLAKEQEAEEQRRRQEQREAEDRQREHEKQLAALQALNPRGSAPDAAAAATSVAAEIEKLAHLLDRGLLTDEEFRAQKSALLSRSR